MPVRETIDGVKEALCDEGDAPGREYVCRLKGTVGGDVGRQENYPVDEFEFYDVDKVYTKMGGIVGRADQHGEMECKKVDTNGLISMQCRQK